MEHTADLTMVVDHGNTRNMKELSISRFKATCLSVIENVRTTGEPVLITRHGKPVAQVVPPPPRIADGKSNFGCMKGTAEELEDILEPLPEDDWEVLR
jgi:prevent-host-death family protein